MLYNILPKIIVDILTELDTDKLYEIRLRAELPVMVNFDNQYWYLHQDGLSFVEKNAIRLSAEVIEEIVFRSADYSLYTVTKQINNGYITIKGGIRIGIAGEVVWDGDNIRAVKNFNAINIRIPHEVFGCCDSIFPYLATNHSPLNALIISPPGAGKTTILRDIARKWSTVQPLQNILIIDERSEIAAVYNSVAQLFVGTNIDIISNCNKLYAFEYAVRAMRPDIIITDEVSNAKDFQAISYALSCGISVIASIHARTHTDLFAKRDFQKNILENQLMDRFIVLSTNNGPGTINGIYNNKLERID